MKVCQKYTFIAFCKGLWKLFLRTGRVLKEFSPNPLSRHPLLWSFLWWTLFPAPEKLFASGTVWFSFFAKKNQCNFSSISNCKWGMPLHEGQRISNIHRLPFLCTYYHFFRNYSFSYQCRKFFLVDNLKLIHDLSFQNWYIPKIISINICI